MLTASWRAGLRRWGRWTTPGGPACVLGLVLSSGCATPADPGYLEAERAFAGGAWQRASEGFTSFSRASCLGEDPSSRCKEAHADLAETYLRLGQAKKAYFALDVAKGIPPFAGPLHERVYRLERQAQDAFAAPLAREVGHGSLTVAFESRTTDRFRFRGAHFLMDLHLLPTDPTARGPGAMAPAVAATQVAAGDHELEIVGEYESSGTLPPGSRFIVRGDHEFRVRPGASGEIQVRFTERSPDGDPFDALSATFHDQGSGLFAKSAPE